MNTRGKNDLEARVAALETNVADHETRLTTLESGTTPPDPVDPPVEPPNEDDTLQELVNAGGNVVLPKAEYKEYCTISKPTQVSGQPTTIDVTGLTISNRKGIFDAQKDLEVVDLVLKGAKVPDNNGAGIRGGVGANITMTDCEVSGCQMGILVSGGGAGISISDCYFHDSGAGDGLSHEIYCSGYHQAGETDFTLENSRIIGGNNTCIAVKVRAHRIVVRNCEIRGSTSTNGSVAGRPVDFPDGGEVLMEDCEIELRSSSPTSSVLGYCTENQNAGAKTVTLRNVVVRDSRDRGGELWARSGVGCKLVLENCKYTASKPPTLTGWASVTGAFTK